MNAPGDPFRFTTIAHADRALLGPLSGASADALLAPLAPAPREPRQRVLDVGCGKGELLLRAVERLAATGTGVDPNPAFVADAHERVRRAGRAGDVTLIEGTLAGVTLPHAAYDLVICTGATHAFGDWPAALAGLRALTLPGGRALAGVGYWRRPPAPAYLAAFGGSADELVSLDATLDAATAAGWGVIARHASTPAEWDAYEGAYAAAMRRWLAAHPDDPDAPAFRARIDAWAGAYARWGRDTLGFVTLLLAR